MMASRLLRRLAVLLLGLGALLPARLHAQSAAPPDTVRLTDGRVLQGQVVSFDGQTLVLRTNDGVQSLSRSGIVAIFIGHGGSTGGLPPGISVGTGLHVVRWTTFRQITNFQRGADHKSIHVVKLSGNGSKIIFGAANGVYTLNPDGSGLARVGEAPDAGLVDISADGRRLAYFSRQEGLIVAAADGSGKLKLPAPDITLTALRMTARGDRVFVIAPHHGDTGGVFEVATDASGVRRILTTTQAAAAVGTDANGNHWRGWPDHIDISDDGTRGVARFLHEVIAFGGGSAPRKLVGLPYAGTYPGAARISDNGRKVTFLLNANNEQSFNIMDFEGSARVAFKGQHTAGYWPQMSVDGTSALLSSGLRFFNADGRSFVDIDTPGSGTVLFEGPLMVSMAADWKRGVMVIDGVLSVDQGRPSQLVVFELNPAQLDGAPTVTDVTAMPRFLPTDGTSPLNVKLSSSAIDPKQLGGVFFRELVRPTPLGLERYYNHPFQRAAGTPGAYTNDFRLGTGWGDVGAGPLMLRLYVQDKQGRTTIVDVAGIEARKP